MVLSWLYMACVPVNAFLLIEWHWSGRLTDGLLSKTWILFVIGNLFMVWELLHTSETVFALGGVLLLAEAFLFVAHGIRSFMRRPPKV